jgi:hypothetical protein
MFRDGFTVVTLGAILCGALPGPSSSLRAEPPQKQASAVDNNPTVKAQDLDPFNDNVMGFRAGDVRNKTNPAGVVLMAWMIEALRPRQTSG